MNYERVVHDILNIYNGILKTINSHFFKGINYFNTIHPDSSSVSSNLVYGGDQGRKQQGINVKPWFEDL